MWQAIQEKSKKQAQYKQELLKLKAEEERAKSELDRIAEERREGLLKLQAEYEDMQERFLYENDIKLESKTLAFMSLQS